MNKTLHYYWLLLVLMGISLISPSIAFSQEGRGGVAIKSNLLYDATSTINLGLDFRLSRRFSLDISGNYNPFLFSDNKQWRHWLVQPEVRFWPRGVYRGHFLALHALGGEYNVGNVSFPYDLYRGARTHRYEGFAFGSGIGYGYHFDIGMGFGFELEVGAGYVYSPFRRYDCGVCGVQNGSGTKHYLGPTKLAVSLVYRFPRRKARRVSTPILVRGTVVLRDTVVRPVLVEVPPLLPKKADTLSFTLRLHYPSGSWVVSPSYGDNARLLLELSEFLARLAPLSSTKVGGIRVVGYSSPDGLAQTNDQLSRERAEAVGRYLRQEYPSLAHLISVVWVGEDWDGLARLIEQWVAFPHKEEVLRIIREVPVLQGREGKLMQLYGGAPYRLMREFLFPKLRRVEINSFQN